MIALAWPIFDALGQLAGFALNCFAVPAFCTVFSCEASCLGSSTLAFWMFVWVPWALETVGYVETN